MLENLASCTYAWSNFDHELRCDVQRFVRYINVDVFVKTWKEMFEYFDRITSSNVVVSVRKNDEIFIINRFDENKVAYERVVQIVERRLIRSKTSRLRLYCSRRLENIRNIETICLRLNIRNVLEIIRSRDIWSRRTFMIFTSMTSLHILFSSIFNILFVNAQINATMIVFHHQLSIEMQFHESLTICYKMLSLFDNIWFITFD